MEKRRRIIIVFLIFSSKKFIDNKIERNKNNQPKINDKENNNINLNGINKSLFSKEKLVSKNQP